MAVPTAIKNRRGIVAKVDWLLEFLAGSHQQTSNNDWVAGVPILKELPFNAATTTLTSETDLGWDIPANSIVLDVWLDVDTVDATVTVDVGILSTEGSGDADGFLKAASVATAGLVRGVPTITTGLNEVYFASTTRGALLASLTAGTDAAGDVGTYFEKPHIVVADSQSVSITASAGTDTAAGKVCILYITTP